jgi:hypothetical protein
MIGSRRIEMFIVCDVLDTDDVYKFVVWTFGPNRSKSCTSQPDKTAFTRAKGAISFANGYISGIREMNYKTPTPYAVPEILKTKEFLDELRKEEMKWLQEL